MSERDELFERGLAAVNRLTALLAEETRLIAAGRVNEGLALAARKADAAEAVGVVAGELRALDRHPDEARAEALRQRIEAMQETLAVNLAVLATTRSVSESLLRDVSRRMAAPLNAAYGPTGPARAGSVPIVLSRAT